MKLAKLITLLSLLLISIPSFAARTYTDETRDLGTSSKFHLGFGVGSMKTDIANANSSAIAWTLFAGTEYNRFLSFNVAYTNLGTTDVGGSNLKGTAYSLNVVGTIPVTQVVSMFAKFGFANTGVYFETNGTASATYSQTSPTIGLGVQANVGKKVDVRIAYDNYKLNTNSATTNNADITSVAVVYKF